MFHYIRIPILLCFILNVGAFFTANRILSKNRPTLQTANTGLSSSNIPRLEFGIKSLLFRSRHLAEYKYEISSDWKFVTHEKEFGMIFQIKRVFSKMFSFVKQVLATTSIIASSLLATSLKTSLTVGSALASVSISPSSRKYSKLSSTQKLSTTPLFFIANSNGSPYLQEDVQAGKPEQRIVTYFMSSDDANEYLNEIAQGNPSDINGFRIFTTTLEKVVNSIESRKQSRKVGRYPINIILRIQPSIRQVQNAELVEGKGNQIKGAKSLQGISIPMFCAEGLVLKRANGEIFVPYYFCHEDLLDDWIKVKENSKLLSPPNIMIKDFREVMCLSQGINKNLLQDSMDTQIKINDKNKLNTAESNTAHMMTNQFTSNQIEKVLISNAIMPPRREIDMLRQYYRNGEGNIKNTKEFQKSRLNH